MTTTDEKTFRKLARVAEVVATQQCEAVAAGQQPCPLQYDDQEHWCLSCLAKRALQDYLGGP